MVQTQSGGDVLERGAQADHLASSAAQALRLARYTAPLLVGDRQSLTGNAGRDSPPVGRIAIAPHEVVLVCAGNGWPVLTAELRQKVTGSTSCRSLGLVLDSPKHYAARHRKSV